MRTPMKIPADDFSKQRAFLAGASDFPMLLRELKAAVEQVERDGYDWETSCHRLTGYLAAAILSAKRFMFHDGSEGMVMQQYGPMWRQFKRTVEGNGYDKSDCPGCFSVGYACDTCELWLECAQNDKAFCPEWKTQNHWACKNCDDETCKYGQYHHYEPGQIWHCPGTYSLSALPCKACPYDKECEADCAAERYDSIEEGGARN